MAKKTEKKTEAKAEAKTETKAAKKATGKPAFQPLESNVYKEALEVDGGVIVSRGNTLKFIRNKTIQDGKLK